MNLDPDREADIERRLIGHFSRLAYPDVALAARWSLSIAGAAGRFRPLRELLEVARPSTEAREAR